MAKPRQGRGKYSKPLKKKKPISGNANKNGYVDKKRKNNRFIQRGKEMVDTHRKQKVIEDKYRREARSALHDEFGEQFEDLHEVMGDADEAEEENPFDELLSTLDTGKKAERVDSDEEEEESDEDENQEDEDDMSDVEDGEEAMDDLEEGEEEEDLADDEEADSEDDAAMLSGAEVEEDDSDGELDEDEEEMGEVGESGDEADDDGVEEDDKDLLVEAEAEEDEEEDATVEAEDASAGKASDTFALHLDYELPPKHVESLLAVGRESRIVQQQWPTLGNVRIEIPITETEAVEKGLGDDDKITDPCIKEPKVCAVNKADDLLPLGYKPNVASNATVPLTKLQSEVVSVLSNYQDLYYPQRTFDNAAELRDVFCLHALNHMLKTRARIMHHNAKIAAATKKKSKTAYIMPDSYRDQGLVRPKVLFVLPVRESAFNVVNCLGRLMYGDQFEASKSNGNIINYERFAKEYTGDTIRFPKTNPKPEDYEKTFKGNSDDNFRIGISLTKKCIKLYTEFYASDILIASPLGLRMIIGAQGSAERDYDFLNSIELLIVDQAELIFAQNWENLLHVLDHLHLQPQSLRNTDFQRVRPWCLSGLSRFYRQTVLLTAHELPEFRAVFSQKCSNYRGKVRSVNPVLYGDIRNVCVLVPQIFQRVNVTSLEDSFDQRFKYFVREILPRFRAPSYAHCMIYVPSYFDYVRLRNHFKGETINFVQICEYTKDGKIARARDMFYHSGAHFLLYSERSHFFKRTRIKGIRHLIMYQPPMWPHFYSEMLNLMQDANQNAKDGLEDSMSVTVLYTKYDVMQLNAILGTDKAAAVIKSGKSAYAFASE